MARMIPPAPPIGTPGSELAFFRKLAGESGTSDWTVFHSLGLSSSYTGYFGEIDFVVLIPGRGVVCVEVKGGGVAQRDGQWTSRDHSGITHKLKRSPFAQVQDAMFKLRRAIEQQFGKGSLEARSPTGFVVVFPDVDCPPPCPEFSRRDVIDRQDLDGPIADLVAAAPTLQASVNKSDVSFGPAPLQNLRKFFRPDFDRVMTAGACLKPVEDTLRALTEEQYDFLDAVELNRRCILAGPAGSGKTTLALEYARRLSAEGRSVFLGCFNRKLGNWLTDRAQSMGPGRVVAGSLHKLLDDRIDASSYAAEFRKNRNHPGLFKELYPLYGAMAIDEISERFDAVLVDEAQDFHPATLIALAEAWTSGVPDPTIVLFGDYERQAIYDSPGDSLQAARDAFRGALVLPLKKNCRNTRRIAVQTSSLSGYRGLQLNSGQPDGDAVETTFFINAHDQGARLGMIFTELQKQGVGPEDVVVLGRYRLENSGLAIGVPGSPWHLSDQEGAEVGKNTVPYATIHSFKGLESPVIILVDVDTLDEGEGEALLYVGMSRARARLYMMIDSRCRSAFDRKIAAGLKEIVGG